MEDEQRKTLELDDLPNEVKALIVARIADLDEAIEVGEESWRPIKLDKNGQEEDEEWETDSEDDDEVESEDEDDEKEAAGAKKMIKHRRFNQANLRSIACVTKEFRDLALPLLYARLELDDVELDQMLFCLQEIVPKYKRYILAFSFSMNNESPEMSCEQARDLFENGQTYHSLPIKRKLETALGVKLDLDHECNLADGADQPMTNGTLQARALLISRMLQQCDRLEVVERDYSQREFFDGRTLPNPRPDEMIDLVIETKFANQLVDYTIDSTDDDLALITDAHMIRHLGMFQNLRRLELLEPVQSTGLMSKLCDTISNLPKLEVLSLAHQSFVNYYFARTAVWKAPLTDLSLCSCEEIRLSDLHVLVSKFKDTLRRLELDEVPVKGTPEQDDKWLAKKFDLPNLERLSLAGVEYPALFLEKFSPCTKLADLYFADNSYVSFDEFQRFIDDHIDTLRSVTLGSGHPFTYAQEEILEQRLFVGRNIEFMVEDPSDDEDDDEDEDDMDGYDDPYDESDGDYYARYDADFGHDDEYEDDGESATYSDI